MNESNIKHEELFNLADKDLKDGYFEAGVSKLEQILEEDPHFGKAYNHLGWLNETKFKNFKKAEEYYKLSIEYSPEYRAGYTNFAILLSTLGRFQELEELLEKAMLVPGIDRATIYNEYGIMYEQKGLFEKAITYYKDCARSTMNQKTMNTAMDSIKRCESKKGLI